MPYPVDNFVPDGFILDVATSPGAWTIPTNLNRPRIKTIVSI